MLAVFFLMAIQAVPAGAGTDWKDAVADVAEIRDGAIAKMLELVADYQGFLATGPTAEAADAELGTVTAEMASIASEESNEIRSIMNEYPRAPQVQDAGAFALGLIGLAQGYAVDRVTVAFDSYVAGLPGSGIPPSTTTTTLPSVTTTTLPPVTTTTLPSVTTTTLPPVTTTTRPLVTTTLPPLVTTTTLQVTTTTLRPTTTTTTTTVRVPATTTTTASVAGASSGGDGAAQPRASSEGTPGGSPPSITEFEGTTDALRSGGEPVPIGDPLPFEDSELGVSFLPDQRGITASLTRILEPVLPGAVAEVVVSPLLIFELVWRAISSSGRGLVMPIALLVFSVISLLWDRRSKKAPAVAKGTRRRSIPVIR